MLKVWVITEDITIFMLTEWYCIRKKYQFDKKKRQYVLDEVFEDHCQISEPAWTIDGSWVCNCGMWVKDGDEKTGFHTIDGLDGIWKFEHMIKKPRNKKLGE